MSDEAENTETVKTRRTSKVNAEEAAAAATTRAQAIVDQWVAERLRNSDIARDTKAWNTVHHALPHLVTAIAEEINA